MRILFVTYDGPQVNYLETLFLPIFAGLRSKGINFDVLQFGWGDAAVEERSRSACEQHGIGYRRVRVWRGSVGALVSMLAGARHLRRAVRAFRSDLIMPRSLMPALAVLAAGKKKLPPIIFDADGLAADERVEFAGLSPTGAVYRILRDIEAQMIRLSGATITRTARAADILQARAGPPVDPGAFFVVANGRDETVFQPFDEDTRLDVRRRIGVEPSCPLIAYAGSIGPQYRMHAIKSLLRSVRHFRPDARLLLMSGSPAEAEAAMEEQAVASIIMRVEPDHVSRFLAAADVGLAYRSRSFSMQAVAPVKLSEYLLCGLPVIGSGSVGDTAPLVEQGLLFDDDHGTTAAAEWFIRDVLPSREVYRQNARAAGQAYFSLNRSLADYARALSHFQG